MEVAEHQMQWGREAAPAEELQMRRRRRPETVADVDFGEVFAGDAVESGSKEVDEVEIEGSQPNHELFVPGNGECMVEDSVTENGGCKDKFSVPENVESKSEFFVPENGKSKDELSVPEDSESKDELSVPEIGHVQVFDYEENGHVHSTVVSHQYQQNVKVDSLSNSKILPTEKSIEDPHITQSSKIISVRKLTFEGDDSDVLNKGDEELNDFDIERVLKEQNTHDLFCPNCHSCITKRVILRKRKRKVKLSNEDGKHNKPVIDESQLDVITEHTADNQGHATTTTAVDSSQTSAADEYSRSTEPEVFRCLSCFTFFIPTGNGFNLFKVFGDKREKENLQNCEQTSSVKKSWFSSLFASRKEEMLVDKDVEANIVAASEQEDNSSLSPLVVSSSAEGPEVTRKVVANRGEKSDGIQEEVTEAVGPDINHSAALPGKGFFNSEVQEGSTIFKPQQDGLKILAHLTTEASLMEKMQADQKLNTAIGKKGSDDKDLFPKPLPVYGESENKKKLDLEADFPSQNGQNIGVKQAMPVQSSVEIRNVEVTFNDSSYSYGFPHSNVGTKVDIHIENPPRANGDSFSPSLTTSLLLPETKVNIKKDLMGMPEKASARGDAIIIVTDDTQTANSQQAQDNITSARTNLSALTESAEDREFRGVEVIKSIVYGGLIESITSLGVVSSAAGSDTAIINIVALGLANLFGGFFVICHNLWDLKNGDYGLIYSQATDNTPNQGTQRLDKYRDLLGRRENFLLHAIVAILSYTIFGLLPPVIYGFSFRESNDRDFKLIAAAIASLLCIIVLSVGKAYVQRPPKAYIKTVFYYVVLGFLVAGASYVGGDLINKLIVKLGLLSSGVDLSVPMTVESHGQSQWSAY